MDRKPVLFQTMIDIGHDILAKGLNRVRDAIPEEYKCGTVLKVYYHYILVLLVKDGSMDEIPKWRDVLISSRQQVEDPSWSPDNLKQYIMYVPVKELLKPLTQRA